jgi:sterol desaturase/sphingolipid hydroxylase (fatty acid hydroxylase superfamily)
MTTVATSAGEGAIAAAAPKRLSLGAAAQIFARYGSPRIMALAAVATLAVRIPLGHWSLADLAVAGGILAVEPFVEWLIHVNLLHFKPRQLFGRRLDPLFAKRHRMHHRDPRNIPLVFVPLPVLAGFLAVLFAIAWFAFPTRYMSVTAFATFTWFFLAYEWSHYLIHSPYVPRTPIFRAVWRAHILHHYKNEKYWFGVTSPIADHVLRTHPAKDSVETSPTARTLGVDDEFELIRVPA